MLPFGLSSVFTKIMRPLVRLWRSKGIKAIVYLDDGIVSSQNESSAKASSAWVRDTLDRAGWVCNESKSVWMPTHELVWLGFNLNLSKGSISVPEGKVRALQHSFKVAVKTSSLLAKMVASLIGRIISMSLALGPVARFRTRALYALLESRQAWCDVLQSMWLWLFAGMHNDAKPIQCHGWGRGGWQACCGQWMGGSSSL